MNAMDKDNWDHCHYATGPLKCILSLGGDESGQAPTSPLFFVTVLKDDAHEVFQKQFSREEKALNFMNERYGHWDLIDTQAPLEEEGGCGSCANK
ncbi:MAG: hypothetical protein OXB88_06660 [Bacteriovoracales bacterium]|nr:hypothetical protein [Bacteriovoracales bacterium]